MSVATKVWRSIGLLGVVLLGIASTVGSGGGMASPTIGCGETAHVLDASVVVNEGQPATLGWGYDDTGAPAIGYIIGDPSTQWHRLDPGGIWTPIPGATGTYYTLTPTIFKRDNSAQFKAIVGFHCGTGDRDTSTDVAVLQVTAGALAWVDVDTQSQPSDPADATVALGATANFVAMAYGDNTYQWQRSNDGGASWADVSGATDWALAVANVQVGDAALFRLSATNRSSAQLIQSRAARLTVNGGMSDAEFAANWTTTKVYDTTAAADAVVTARQQTSGGNPGAFRETTQQWTGGNGVSMGLEAAHLLLSATHDPAQTGAIDHVDFSFDAIVLSQQGGTPGIAVFPLLLQNGTYYQRYDAGNPAVWTHKVFNGLTANDFFNASAGALHPDFSSGGALIQFGYGTANGSDSVVPITTVSGIDNWAVTVVLKP